MFSYRITHSLLSATIHVTEKHLRLETIGAVSFLINYIHYSDHVIDS